MTSSKRALHVLWLCASLAAACGDDGGEGAAGASGGGACLPQLELDCTPRYPATFEQIYDRLIDDTCSAAACHGASPAGNLMFGDADATYATLLDDGRREPLVIPGDPECSVLMKRIESDDLDFVMPARSPLDEDEKCAIRKWIADGAER